MGIREYIKTCSREYRIARVPRKWSNKELKKFAHLFNGKIINVSAWRDEDKEGKKYKDYFINANEYYISNVEGYRGYSGLENEIYLNLEEDLSENLEEKFDVVFNHTTLEHILDISKAFDNLVKLTKDILILVVPYVQDQHESKDYGDYWRFTPLGIVKNLERRGMKVIYLSKTPYKNTSTYLFVIASKKPEKWYEKIENHIENGRVNQIDSGHLEMIYKILRFIKNKVNRKQ